MEPLEVIKSINTNLIIRDSGVYMIYCINNNKCYIGRSKNIKNRWSKHRYMLKRNCHTNTHLQNIYNLYGKNSLLFFVLENTNNRDIREAYWTKIIRPGLLINLHGINHEFPMTEITRFKISQSHIGNKYSLGKNKSSKTGEHKIQLSRSKLGRKLSDNHKNNIKIGCLKSLESKRKNIKTKIEEINIKRKDGLTIRELAKLYGVSSTTIYKNLYKE